jgi:hypothetical protein
LIVASAPEAGTTLGEKILSFVLAILFVILAMYFVCWFLFMRRPCREQFRTSEALQEIERKQAEASRKTKNNETLVIFRRLYIYFFTSLGKWKLPSNKRTEEEEQHFYFGEIVIDSFTEDNAAGSLPSSLESKLLLRLQPSSRNLFLRLMALASRKEFCSC